MAVLYKGSLYHELKKELYSSLKIYMELEVGKDNISNIDVDVIIAILDDISYGEILDLNKNLYISKKPYMFVYYNGEGIVCGPFVIPGKTACFECLLTHRIKKLEGNGNEKIGLDNFRRLIN